MTSLKVDRKTLRVTNLDKVLYSTGFTKGQVIDYYVRIAPMILPHLKDRPITFKRYPDGVEGQHFYEKHCPTHRPGWVKTHADRYAEGGKLINSCLVNDRPTLVWAANLAALELHTSLARAKDVHRPTMIAFDLDPGPPAGMLECLHIAMRLRKALERLNLQSFPKTSGGKGIHLLVPLNTPVTYEQTKPLASAVAQMLADEQPDKVVAVMAKAQRKGKVFIDWSQNTLHKTTVCVYSLRARERPTVSTPITWDELEAARKKKKPDRLVFETDDVLKRVGEHGDLMADVLKKKQKLPR